MWRRAKVLMIISRYLMKEVLTTLLAVTFVLLLIFLSQQLVRYLGYAASGKIAANLLLQIIGFSIPTLLALLLPLGLFLGIILAYGRLYADNELRVLHACGLGILRLTKITGSLAVGVVLVVAYLMLWLNPILAADKQKALTQGSADHLLETLMPGRFQATNDGRRVVYVEQLSRNRKTAHNIFIAEQGAAIDENRTHWTVLSASEGYQAVDAETYQALVVAKDGYRYEGAPGQNNYKIIQFKKYAIRIPGIHLDGLRQVQEAIPTLKLLQNHSDPEDVAEWQWRLSIPLSALLLALLAIPLSQVKPRQGRYAILFPAILIYIVYMNLLFVGRNMLEQKTLPLGLGLWWVHLVIIMIIGILMLRWRRGNV